ncbi:H/ACA ribonucleoprotein complex subunit 4 [Nematocida sp. AWRm77]|nr:H/ACA ribonucleoprotein complex subunit 4 [Nematocida sp. AWRm77]
MTGTEETLSKHAENTDPSAHSEMLKKVEEALTAEHTGSSTQSEEWPILLRGLEKMNVKSLKYTPTEHGYTPQARPIDVHMMYGVINLDKPCNPSSHEVVSWVKKILRCDKTGHSGTLDPIVSGCLPVCLNKATRIAKTQQDAGKEYVGVVEFSGHVTEAQFKQALHEFTGPLLQRPPEQCAVKRVLRIRTVVRNEFLDFDEKKRLGMFRTSCEAGTYIRTLCVHMGLFLGVQAEMVDLRRVRSGAVKEDSLVTMHDVLDSMYLFDKEGKEKYLRSVVLPLETLLVNYPRIVIKDSAINAICFGGQLTAKGILRYDNFNHQDAVVIVSPKGEAVAMGVALTTASQLHLMEHGVVARTKRVIMEKNTYPKQWMLGPGAHTEEGPETEGVQAEDGSKKEDQKKRDAPAHHASNHQSQNHHKKSKFRKNSDVSSKRMKTKE